MKNFLSLILPSSFILLPFSWANSQTLTWPDPVANHVVPYQSLGITHGPVLGGVTDSTVKVWIRTQEAMPFEILVSESLPFDSTVSTQGTTNLEEDFTGWVQVTELKANTHYYYAVVVSDEIVDTRHTVDQPWPSFRTLPNSSSYPHEYNPKGLFNFSFSVGACQRQRSPSDTYGVYADPPVFNTLWENHRDRIAFHIINGDYTYEETLNGEKSGLENNYKLYLERSPSLNRFLRDVPMFTVFNDHEMTDNIDGAPEFKTLKPYIPKGLSMKHLGLFMNKTFSGRLNEDRIKAIRDIWNGKLVVKGIVNEEDCEKVVRLGADGIIASNHGGRQLDAGQSTIKPLPSLVREFGDKITVMIDSGIRGGPDIACALASGAQFTFMGRSFMYGVGALGKRGGSHTMTMLKRQLQQVMEQLACEKVQDFPNHLITD